MRMADVQIQIPLFHLWIYPGDVLYNMYDVMCCKTLCIWHFTMPTNCFVNIYYTAKYWAKAMRLTCSPSQSWTNTGCVHVHATWTTLLLDLNSCHCTAHHSLEKAHTLFQTLTYIILLKKGKISTCFVCFVASSHEQGAQVRTHSTIHLCQIPWKCGHLLVSEPGDGYFDNKLLFFFLTPC